MENKPIYPFPGEIEKSEHYWRQLEESRYQVLKYRDGHFEIAIDGVVQYKTISIRYGYYNRVPLIFKSLADARLALARIKAADYQAHAQTEERYRQQMIPRHKVIKRIPLVENIPLGHQCQ
jgi:hypothetical protein